jgi:3-phenylpropionate/cinnamic acid dioxygenase small subunit
MAEESFTPAERERLRDLLIRDEIMQCLYRYARGLDRHDDDLIASAFWPDAEVNYLEDFSGSRDPFVDWGNRLHDSKYEIHQHHLTTRNVDVDGDTAHVESYVIYMLRSPEKLQYLGSGRYIDKCERRDGEWRIALREFVPEMRIAAEDHSSYERADPPGPSYWDKRDISYLRPMRRRNGED